MLIRIKTYPKFKNKVPFQIQNPPILQEKIDNVWNDFIKDKQDFFNGDIFIVTDIINNNDKYTLEIAKTKYADLVYSRKTQALTRRSLFSAILLETKDNYYVIVKDRRNKLNLLGGLASDEDFTNNNYNPTLCLKRELKEEINLDLEDKNIILDYAPIFLKIPVNEKAAMYTIGIIYTATLNYTKDELNNYFNNNKNNFDNEINELLYCTKNNYKEIKDFVDTRKYIFEALEILLEEK